MFTRVATTNSRTSFCKIIPLLGLRCHKIHSLKISHEGALNYPYFYSKKNHYCSFTPLNWRCEAWTKRGILKFQHLGSPPEFNQAKGPLYCEKLPCVTKPVSLLCLSFLQSHYYLKLTKDLSQKLELASKATERNLFIYLQRWVPQSQLASGERMSVDWFQRDGE